MKIFVYGTLMQGESNHGLLSKSTFLGEIKTAIGYDLISINNRFPAMICGEGRVKGELYEIDKDTLEIVDRLENHPHFYQRKNIILEDGDVVLSYVIPRIPSGSWREHQKKED